ncbi:uncharacterized protein DUF3857 [Chitinophaga polysaccharea]|uniref:Uncharacterized protein DUF3857 n=1 Tax=Chitinophaga polysaccharea TaxID=1293035 RepID=A0A561PLZ3_9BACT|nr:DUF3857 domain-containing protein [Chitinophaga polysaccharea]TWF39121.1 uncharacterized protein DUF3857 [Chitinophaga polysaccharea]
MKKWFLLLAVAGMAILPTYIQAQVNSYFPEIWKEKPQLHTVPATNEPYAVIDYRIIRDFNVSAGDRSAGCTQYKTIYKIVKINTRAGADSLTQLIMDFEANETLRGLHLRALHPNGEVADLADQVRMIHLSDDRSAVVVTQLALQPGSEIEYELNLKVDFSYAGSDFLQSSLPCNHVSFTLVAPKGMSFKLKSTSGLPPISDSTGANSKHYYWLNVPHMPALKNNDLYYMLPQLQRVDFALHQAIDGKDTSRMTWQQFGEDNYIPFVAVSKAEYKQLEKEIQKWPFTQQRMPATQMIYLVEQYIKSNIQLVPPEETGETVDLISILRNRRAEKAGFTRLLNAVYYVLNIPTQILFTSSRDSLLIDSQLVVRQLPSNVLLYFPTVQQALAPTEMNTRFPCYPPTWANIPAIRCRDTLVGQESKVLTDIITTPQPPYTLSNITTDATLTSFADATWEVKQSFGGYPAENIKTAFTINGGSTEGKFKIYNAILPFQPGVRKPTAVTAENEVFNGRMLDKPVLVNSTLRTPSLIENKNNEIHLFLGPLLGGTVPVDLTMPEGNLPVQITFPYYQEKRVHITLPAGYKVANKAAFQADISDTGAQPALGLKMRCEQDGNQLNIFVLEWYRQTDFTGNNKQLFSQLVHKVHALQQQYLVLVKE